MYKHPDNMFCEATLRLFAEGHRRLIDGKEFGYHSMLDTYIWADEDPETKCSECMDVLQLLWLRRRTLWGGPPTEFERPVVWETVKNAFPEWPGFTRKTKPKDIDEEGDRRVGEEVIRALAEAAAAFSPSRRRCSTWRSLLARIFKRN